MNREEIDRLLTAIETLTEFLEGNFDAITLDNYYDWTDELYDMQTYLEQQLAHLEKQKGATYHV